MKRTSVISVSFEAPPILLDFLSFIYRLSFMERDYDDKKEPLLWGWERTSPFEITAPYEKWNDLFTALNTLDDRHFTSRPGVLAFAVYTQLRNHPAITVEVDDKIADNDPVLEKRRLFEACSATIMDVSDSQVH